MIMLIVAVVAVAVVVVVVVVVFVRVLLLVLIRVLVLVLKLVLVYIKIQSKIYQILTKNQKKSMKIHKKSGKIDLGRGLGGSWGDLGAILAPRPAQAPKILRKQISGGPLGDQFWRPKSLQNKFFRVPRGVNFFVNFY